MAFARTRFGIEYNPNPIDEESSGAGWLVAVIVLAAIAVLAAARHVQLQVDLCVCFEFRHNFHVSIMNQTGPKCQSYFYKFF